MSFRRCPHHLIICGPGLLAGQVPGIVSCHNDLTPTILKLAGSDRPDHDGSPIPLTQKDLATPQSLEHINVEFLGFALSEGQIRLAIRQSCRYREQHLQGVTHHRRPLQSLAHRRARILRHHKGPVANA